MCRFCKLAAVMALLVASPLAAQPQQSHPCAGTVDAGERLACYDRAFPPVAGARPAPLAQHEREARARADFGLPAARRAADPALSAVEAPDRMSGEVASVERIETGQRVVRLANGQVWLLTEATGLGPIKAGDAVTIRKALMGTYMMRTPGGVDVRARRMH